MSEVEKKSTASKTTRWLAGGAIILFLLKKGGFIVLKIFKFGFLFRYFRREPWITTFVIVGIILLFFIIRYFYKKRKSKTKVWDSQWLNDPAKKP